MIKDANDLKVRYERIEGVRLSMVTSASLQTSGASLSSNDVSNSLDRELLKHLRSIADVSVSDVATAIAEGYRPSKLVAIELWTKSGNSRGLVDQETGVFKRFKIKKVDDPIGHLQALRQTHSSILLETGPTLTVQLAEAQAIDEACITVTQAPDELSAISSLESFASQMHLDYLLSIEAVWLEDTLFARLAR
jgi:riboflavin biosynthesis pyrimidine reductase